MLYITKQKLGKLLYVYYVTLSRSVATLRTNALPDKSITYSINAKILRKTPSL